MILSNQRQHLFPLSLLLMTLLSMGLINFYSFYLDEDAIWHVLTPLKLGTLSLRNIRLYSMLFPVIMLVSSSYINPLTGYMILGVSTGFGIALLVYWIIISQTKNRIVGILCMLLVLIINGIHINLRKLDDNIFPLPFVLLSVYLLFVETQQPAEKRKMRRIFVGGLLLSIAIAFHLQTVILIPLLVFCLLTDYRVQLKRRLLNSWIAFLGIVAFIIPLFLLAMDARGTLSIESLINPTGYIPFIFTTSFPSKEQTVTESINWIFRWLSGMIKYSSPFLLFESQGILFFISSIIWFGIFLGVPLISLIKPFPKQKKTDLFISWGYMAFLLTSIYAFIFEAENPERWAQAIPFLVINFGIGLNSISKAPNFWNYIYQKAKILRIFKVLLSLNRWISNSRVFGLLIVCLVLTKYSASFAYAVLSPTRNDWPYPNKLIIDDIIQSVPEDAPLILGDFFSWHMVSYYRLGWTLYVDWDKQLQYATICENGCSYALPALCTVRLKLNMQLNESSISSILRTFLDRGIVVFAHEDVIPFLKALGFDTDYNLTVYKEFRHWYPLDLIKGKREPNRIYSIDCGAEG